MPFPLLVLFFCVMLSSCATTGGPGTGDQSVLQAHSGPSRAMYLYSRSRLASIDGDYPAALSILRDAIEADPTSAFLHAAAAELKLKIGQSSEALEYINKAIGLDPSIREPYVLGGVLMASSGKDWEAADYLRKAIKLDPAKEDAYLHLAVSLTRLFEYEEAVNNLKSLVKIKPDSVLGYYYLGRTYSQMKLHRDAAGYFRKAMELRPEFSQAGIDMAASYEAQGDYNQAIEAYRALLGDSDHRSLVLQRLIQLLIQQRRFEEALQSLNMAVESGLGGQETMRKIGLLHLELEQYDDAVRVFDDMLEKEPTAHQIRLYLGISYEEKGDLDKAYAEFRKIPVGTPVYVEAIGHIAFVLKEKGQDEAAIAAIRDAIAVNPSAIELYLNLSSLYESIDRPQAALELLQGGEARFAAEPRFHFRFGVLLDKVGDKQGSITRMKKVLSLNPKDAQALNFIGYSYAEAGENLDEALAYVKQAVELRPNDGFIIDSLGWVYFKMKKYDEAVRYLEEAVRLVDDDSTIIEHLGDAHLARHENRKAIKMYRKALQLDPARKELTEKLRKARGEPADR